MVIVLKPMTYLDALELDGLSKLDMAKKMLKCSTELSDEEIAKLNIKEGLMLQSKINEMNGLNDFQMPTENVKKE